MFFGKASSFPGGSILVPCPTMCSDCEIELEAFKRSLDAYPNYEEMVLTDLLADPNVPTPGRGASQLAMQHFTTRLRCALVDPTVFGKLVGAIPWAGRPKNADSVLSLMALQFGTSLENLKAFSSEWQQYVAKLGRDGLHPEDRAPGLAILAKYELDKIIPKVDRSNDPRLNQDSIDDASGLLVDGAILVLTASEGNALKFALARMSENLGRELTAAEVAALAENRELLSAIWSTLKTSGCACFPANTPVLMGDGTRKAIAAIRAGDLVWSRDAATGKSGPQAVTATPSLLHTDRVTLSLATPSGKAETLLTTLQHPFWVEGKGFAPASALRAGDRIGSADEPAQGPLLAVASRWNDTSGALLVKAVTVEADGVAPWMGYNLTVAASHTFFVGKAGAWVHNTSLSCGFRILTHSEARALGYDGTKGVVFVLET